MNDTKRGIYTSEFWLTLVGQLVPILVSIGVLIPNEAVQLQDDLSKAIVAGFAFIGAAATVVMYIYSRTQVKKSVIEK